MMDAIVFETMMLAFEDGAVALPETGDILFLRAEVSPMLARLPKDRLICHNGFKPADDALLAAGYRLLPPETEVFPTCALTLLAPARQKDEARGQYARALLAAPEGGVVLAALPNTLGGKTAQKTLGEISPETASVSKHKCRAFWTVKRKEDFNIDLAKAWVAKDAPLSVAGGEMWSRPGLFSWNRVDAGSELLADSVPETIKGRGADFGAGQGYLSKQVLTNCPKVTSMDLYEAEYRALECAGHTLEGLENATIKWADATRDVPKAMYDFIVMNPPFHVGRKDAAALGQAFIQAAARSLKGHGALYMVANRHLPYEAVLSACFKSVEMLEDEGGYKIIRAERPKKLK